MIAIAADAIDCQSPCSQILQRREPRGEDWSDSFVSLELDAADPSGAVVKIEIARELLVFGGARLPIIDTAW